ncbi:MAG TPA: hypothetical protein VE135_14635 [Pyrinomonadaceae bacterium]|nr:hypothetical protein [Pyrinomonadaceae bacterium]
MKRVILVVLLVGIAGIAGIVRSHCKTTEGQQLPASSGSTNTDTREEIRKTVELSPGARVEVSGINGAVKIETSTSQTAEIYVERTGAGREVLERRKVLIDSNSDSLRIHGEKGDAGFFARLFGSNPTERVTLKLPRRISLVTNGVNGSVIVGEVDGPVEVHGINGKVEIGQALGSAEFKGINGNIAVSLKDVTKEGVTITGVNGNIELRLSEGLNAELEAHGMNGRVVSDLSDVVIEKERHGSYLAHVGSGGNSINANGINGNIRLTRATGTSTTEATEEQ